MMGGARFMRKPVILISRPCVRHCSAPSQNRGNVVIPPRIERGPTDILKALSSTVGRDHTAFHYKYPDDPHLYPRSENLKIIFALSMESGRKSARWVFKNNPVFFKNQLSEPLIEEFFVKPVISVESKPSEETLLSAIEKRNVLKAIEVYEALESEKHDVSESTKQCLLELTCFYNCEERENKDLEEKWFFDEKQRKKIINIWKHQGFAEKLFETMNPSCPLANSAIIQGMLKHNEFSLAYKIFEEARMKKVKLSVDVYNMFLSNISEGKSEKKFIKDIQKILNEMIEKKVRPNVGTLNAIFKSLVLSQEYSKINFALDLMKEFENLGIEPSLGTYGYLFRILSYAQGPRVMFLSVCCEIMSQIENKKFEILHPSDLSFFTHSSTAFGYYMQEPDLSLRLLEMYYRNNNSKFMINFYQEKTLFKDLLPCIFKEKPIEISMEVYRRFFYRDFDPYSNIFGLLISAIGKYDAPQYLAEIWEDIKQINLYKNVNILISILSLVENFSDELSIKVFHSAAISLFSCVQIETYDCRNVDSTAFSNILIAFVKNDDEKNVLKFLDHLKRQLEINLNQHSTELLFNYGLSKQKIPILLESLRIAADAKLPTVAEMAKKSLPFLEDDSKAWATQLMNKAKEKNTSNKSE